MSIDSRPSCTPSQPPQLYGTVRWTHLGLVCWLDAVIDREAMGSSEQEPQATAALRKTLMEEQPDVWSMLTQEDPTLKRSVA